jgi:hypothetical protein
MEFERHDDVADRWPGLFNVKSDRDVSVLTVSSGHLLEPRLTLAGHGSFDRELTDVITSVTTLNPWGQDAFALWLNSWPDTAINRRLGLFTRYAATYKPRHDDLDAVGPSRNGRVTHGALIRLDAATFRQQTLPRVAARPIVHEVLLPTQDGRPEAALHRLITALPDLPDATRPERAAAIASRLLDIECCVLRIWLDDDASYIDVTGPTSRVIELESVVRHGVS